MKHKHYDQIIAFANGSEIELKSGDKWVTTQNPSWYDNIEYRIKPKEPKKVSMWQWVYEDVLGVWLTLGFFPTKDAAKLSLFSDIEILYPLESSHILVEEKE